MQDLIAWSKNSKIKT